MPIKNLRIRSHFLLDMQVPAWLSRLPGIARIILFAGIAGFLSVPSLQGQSAGLSGVVSDATGGVIPEAEIAVMNEETGLQRSA
ncbi:MAG: carboxypeptidase-like regulatory domain-containing protein, partial [Bryobacterales bacterium]|nr:carboxypeptidase-like regulatory domain-containing protein [Bryobacterales bacterium]